MSRSVRATRTFAANAVGSVVVLGTTFVATPILLRYLGADRIGVYRVALEWMSYLSLFDVGVGGALAPLLVRAATTGGPAAVRDVLAAGIRAYARVAVAALVAGAVLVFAIPWLITVPDELLGELQLGAAVGLFTWFVLPLTVYRPLAESRQRGDVVGAFAAAQSILGAVGSVAAAYCGGGLVGQFAVASAASLTIPVGLLLLHRREFPPRSLIAPPTDPTTVEDLSRLNRATLTNTLVGRLCLFSDSIVLGFFVHPAEVARFFLSTRLTQAASAQVQTVGAATWAGLAELWQSGEHDRFRLRVVQLTRLTAAFGGLAVVPLAVLTRPFVGLWVGPGQYAGDAVAVLATLNGVLLPVFSFWGWLFSGTGRAGRLVKYMILQAVLNVAASVAATAVWGTPGPLIGTAFVNVAYNPWVLGVYLRRDFGIAAGPLFSAAVLPLLLAAAFAGVLKLVEPELGEPTWWRIAAEFAAVGAAYAAAAWWLLLSAAERASTVGLVRTLAKRR